MTQPTKPPLPKRWATVPAGVMLALLAWAGLVPAEARAGCSYPGHTRIDRALLPSILREATSDREGGAASPLPNPGPRSPGPCRGAWCHGGQDVPAAPPGTIRLRAEQWAWQTAVPASDPSSGSPLVDRAADFFPSRGADPLFRPPRPCPRA